MKRVGTFLAGLLALAILMPSAWAKEEPKKDAKPGADAPKEKKIPDEVKKFFDKQYFPQKHGLKDARVSMNLGMIPQLAAMAPDAKIVVLWKAPDKTGMKLEGFPSEGPAAQMRGMILQQAKNMSGSGPMSFIPQTLEELAKTNSFKAEKDGDNTKITMTNDEDETSETILWADKDQKLVRMSNKQGLQSSDAEITCELKDGGYVVTEMQMDSPMGAVNVGMEYEQIGGVWMRKVLITKQSMGEGEMGEGMRMEMSSEVNKGVTDEEIKAAQEEAEMGGAVDEGTEEEDEETPPAKKPAKKSAPAEDEDE